MKQRLATLALVCLAVGLCTAPYAQAAVTLLANAQFTGSSAGYYTDLSGLNYPLENGVSASLLGGLGSAIAIVCSWQRNRSILWAILAGIFSWFYVIYFAATRKPDEQK